MQKSFSPGTGTPARRSFLLGRRCFTLSVLPALGFLFLGGPAARAEAIDPAEERASAALVKRGAWVERNERLPGKPVVRITAWEKSQFGNADLALLKVFKKLRGLNLNYNRNVTNDGLKHLQEVPQLEELDLTGTLVTDAGLAHLRALKHLHVLKLGSTITDAGMKHLVALKELQEVSLVHGRVGDAGLQTLAALTGLRSLNLCFSKVTDAGLKAVGKLTELKSLDIAHTKVTDAGLAHLRGLTNLRSLNMCTVKITDAGLAHFHNLKELRTLTLCCNKVTYPGVEALRKALPKLDIIGFGPGSFRF